MRLAILVALISASMASAAAAAEPYCVCNTATGEVSIHNLRGFEAIFFVGDENQYEEDGYLVNEYLTSPPATGALRFVISGPFRAFFPPSGEDIFTIDSVAFSRVVTDPIYLNRLYIAVAGDATYRLTPQYIPEPSSLCIAGTGLAFLAALRCRK